ncbi:MAG: hypothetical protein LUD19_03475 [Clostridia bacterium]|nr:hypothetical protein [Clostridia bacterium]
MTLEDIIYSRLTASDDLQRMLAEYAENPAVFYMNAPDDKADGWASGKQYPRIAYMVDLQSNPERKTSGVLTLDIYCTEDGITPEEIEPTVRQMLCGVFIQPDNAPPFAMAWAKSEAYDQRTENDGLIIGVSVTFDIYAFPNQITSDPDPVLAMNHYIEENAPEMFVIGSRVQIDGELVPTFENPAIYFRQESIQIQRETNTVAWMDAVLACHIFAGGGEVEWMRELTNALALAGEVIMLDKSPMFITNLKADSTLDALSTGQLRFYVRFGILRRPKYTHPLLHPNRELISKGG